MKRHLLLIVFIFSCLRTFGQNYKCFQAGARNYYTNGNGYLRGIRIDSVRTSGSDTLYYPFHSFRAKSYLLGGAPGSTRSLDSNGGSWLGKKVVEKTDGTFLFDDVWHDTVVIKTRANVGDTWKFYDDTTQVSYNATLTSLDTMTVLGILDSVKTITISADSAGVVRFLDPVNNFKIKLSKNHGFVDAIDLYTFPFHFPNQYDKIRFIDYYLDLMLGNLGFGDLGLYSDNMPDTANSIFHIVPFYNPTLMEVHNFGVGDIFESTYHENYPYVMSGLIDYYESKIDTVLSKTGTLFDTSYVIREHSCKTYVSVTGGIVSSTQVYGSWLVNSIYDTSRLINPDKMPEEWRAKYFYHYFPSTVAGTLPCYSNALYGIDRENVFYDSMIFIYLGTFYDGDVEFSNYADFYKPGCGLDSINRYDARFQYYTTQTHNFVQKGGITCSGTFSPVPNSIEELNKKQQRIEISPNPANEELTIKSSSLQQLQFSLVNAMGQVVIYHVSNALNTTFNTANLPPGLYNLIVADENSNRTNYKLVVVH